MSLNAVRSWAIEALRAGADAFAASISEAVITAVVIGTLALAYRWISRRPVRRAFLLRLRDILHLADHAKHQIDAAEDDDAREEAYLAFAQQLEIMATLCRDEHGAFGPKHKIFLGQIGFDATTRRIFIRHDIEYLRTVRLDQPGAIKTQSIEKSDDRKRTIRNRKLSGRTYFCKPLYNAERFLKKYNRHLRIDYIAPIRGEESKKIAKDFFEDRQVSLDA